MPARVASPNEVSINGVFYPTKGPVQTSLDSVYPQKIVIGDVSKDSQQRASVLAWSDWRSGIGLSRLDNDKEVNRAWWSTCQLRFKGHLVLPRLATATAATGVGGIHAVYLAELANEVYAFCGTDVRKYNNDTDSWGSSLATLPAPATDALTCRLGGTVYLVVATTSGYTYTSDGVTWTDDTKDTKYLAFWNDQLWGIDNTGQTWFATAIGTETNDAILPLPDGYVTDFFVGRDADTAAVLYAMTKAGLFAHDFELQKFEPTEFFIPNHPYNGLGSQRWRDSIFIPAGNATYRYQVGGNGAIVRPMGPDRDHGLPSDKRGYIKQLIATHNDLLALVDATTPQTTFDNYSGMEPAAPAVIGPGTGYSTILGWDEQGWEAKWLSSSDGTGVDMAMIANAYDVYRLWWSQNMTVYWMTLPIDLINPDEVSDMRYATSGEHITPWYDAGQKEITKTALQVKVETDDCSTNETVVVDYAVDYSTSWTNLGTISSDGVTTYKFPDSTTPTGTDFRAIRFRATLARGGTATLSPDVLSLTLEFRKKISAKYKWATTLDLSKECHGKTPKDLRSSLVTAASSTTLVEFTFRDDTGDTRNYYVDVMPVMNLEQTGHDERGEVQVLLVAP